MKKLSAVALSIALLMMPISCGDGGDSGSSSNLDNPNNPSNSGGSISKEYWGTWIRMDNGVEYKINDKTVTVNGVSSGGIGVITKESENVLKYGSEATAPRLFRKGGSNRSFTVQLAGFEDSNGRAVSIGLQGINSRRQNKNNASDKQEVKPDSNGVITFTDAVSEETQNIEVNNTSTDTKVSVDVLPQYDGENVGTIPLIAKGKYALKTTYNVETKLEDYMYGNDYAEYDITLKIENISDVNCAMSVYTISCDDANLKTTFEKTGNIKTLLPGRYNEIKGKVSYGKLEDEYKDVILNIKIEDGASDDTWNDSITLRFYRGRVPLVVNAQSVDNSNNTKLNGFVIYPDSRSKWFSVKSGESSTIWIPYSERDYTLVFSGATENSEMKYSFNYRNLSKLADLSGVVTRDEIKAYEDNNTFDAAYNLGSFTDNIKAALIYGDLDYYKINNKNELIGNLASIKIDTSSMKTSYYLNQSLNTEGLVVKAIYQGGQEVDVSEFVEFGNIDMTTIGTKSLDVSYTEDGVKKSEKIYITVKDFSVSSINVAQKPSKLVYYTEQEFDSNGILVNATTSDGQVIDVTNSVEYEGFNKTKVGSQTITVKLEKNGSRFSDTFSIEMKQLVLESIRIDSKPTKLQYYTGQKFKSEGLKVVASYNSGEEKDCTQNCKNDFDSSNATDSKVVTISYTENGITKNTTFNVIIDSIIVPKEFVFINGVEIDGTETWTPKSELFVSGAKFTIPDLFVCNHEVTQAEYTKIMDENPSSGKSNPASGEVQENRPVENVSWYDALVYCNKRSLSEGLTPCYKVNGEVDTSKWNYIPHQTNGTIKGTITCDFEADGYRLPKEAEWEYAARGEQPYIYAGSDTCGDVAWFGNLNNKTHEVKKKMANGYGLYDMSGNVFEWCWDSYGTTKRYIRGGSCTEASYYCEVSYRYNYTASSRPGNFGLRVVRTFK